MDKQQQIINLRLTVEECNLALDALGALPFSKVYQIIGKIQAQAAEQLSEKKPQSKEEDAGIVEVVEEL